MRVPALAVLLLIIACAAEAKEPPERPKPRVPFERTCVLTCDKTKPWNELAGCYADCVLDLKSWKEVACKEAGSEWCCKPGVSCTDTPGKRVQWINARRD